jgi:uncharacterized membrane protein YadS
MATTSTYSDLQPERAVAALPAEAAPRLVAVTPPAPRRPARLAALRSAASWSRGLCSGVLPGLLAALAVGIVATLIGQNVPLVGSAVPGALIGVLVALTLTWAAARQRAAARLEATARLEAEGLRGRLAPGLRLASSRLLQCSVVILGAQLSLSTAVRVGLSSLPVMLGTLAACLGATFFYGRLLGVVGDLRTLIGVGTGICGASAIAAVSPVIEASSTDIAYAVSTIFLFNITAVLLFPVVGHALGMTQHAFGLFAGTAVNDTSSVVATATTYGSSAASHAVVVKLVRTLMIIPVCVGLGALATRGKLKAAAAAQAAGSQTVAAGTGATGTVAAAGAATPGGAAGSAATTGGRPARLLRLVPWFLVGFVVMAAANSAHVIPSGWHGALGEVSVFLVAVALSAIGLSTDVAALRRAGARPVLLGAMLWVTVSSASLGLQLLTGTLH